MYFHFWFLVKKNKKGGGGKIFHQSLYLVLIVLVLFLIDCSFIHKLKTIVTSLFHLALSADFTLNT